VLRRLRVLSAPTSPGRRLPIVGAGSVGGRPEPPLGPFGRSGLGPLLGLTTLLAPAVASVWLAVTAAGAAEAIVAAVLEPMITRADRLPAPLDQVAAGDFGLLTMGPMLLVWALPVVAMLALLLGVLRTSGLLDRGAAAVHPLLRPVGLTGHDLVRVVTGHGCNVPAVLATRACSSCTRDATIATISFGAACSYQLAATLAVLAAAQRRALVLPYLAVMVAGALLHARLLARSRGRAIALDLPPRGCDVLVVPRWRDVWRDARPLITQVVLRALPIFLLVVLLASMLAATGVLEAARDVVAPAFALLRLPADAALPVVLGAIRKDGLLLLAEPATLAALDDAQLLAALVLASAMLPCLVTSLTIVRERGLAVAGRLLTRQAALALTITAAISWAGAATRL
jgi:ferrous iron transport protein B